MDDVYLGRKKDDGSITVAKKLRMAGAFNGMAVDLEPIIGTKAAIVSKDRTCGASDAAWRLARLIDPVTRVTSDGKCAMCGAPAKALKDAYCAHCGRRILKDEGTEEVKESHADIRRSWRMIPDGNLVYM